MVTIDDQHDGHHRPEPFGKCRLSNDEEWSVNGARHSQQQSLGLETRGREVIQNSVGLQEVHDGSQSDRCPRTSATSSSHFSDQILLLLLAHQLLEYLHECFRLLRTRYTVLSVDDEEGHAGHPVLGHVRLDFPVDLRLVLVTGQHRLGLLLRADPSPGCSLGQYISRSNVLLALEIVFEHLRRGTNSNSHYGPTPPTARMHDQPTDELPAADAQPQQLTSSMTCSCMAAPPFSYAHSAIRCDSPV